MSEPIRCIKKISLSFQMWLGVSLFCLSLGASANGLPIQGETAFVTGLSGAGVRTFIKTSVEPSNDGSDVQFTMPLIALHELIDNKLVIGMGLPMVATARLGLGGLSKNNYGLGGFNLFGKVNLFQLDGKGETLRVTAKFGLGLPTDLNAFFGENGPKIGGPKAASPTATLIVTKLMGRLGLNADVGLQVRQGINGRNPGDVLRYNASVAYRVWPFIFKTYPDHQVNVLLEANGSFISQMRENGAFIEGSGGHTLFLSPGIQYMFGQLLVEVSVQIAAPYVTTGTTVANVPRMTALLGVRWLVF